MLHIQPNVVTGLMSPSVRYRFEIGHKESAHLYKWENCEGSRRDTLLFKCVGSEHITPAVQPGDVAGPWSDG